MTLPVFITITHADDTEGERRITLNAHQILAYFPHAEQKFPDAKAVVILPQPVDPILTKETAEDIAAMIESGGQEIRCTRPAGTDHGDPDAPYDPLSVLEEYFYPQDPGYDLIAHLHRQKAFSEKTFGPGMRTKGVSDHIRKELTEIEADPTDLMEWIDVILLGMDGAWRSGASPEQIAHGLEAKLTRNENREWPDWRTADPDKAIEHVR